MPGAAAAAPRVVATIKPLHALVAGVMAGVAEPELLIRGAGSAHGYNLRPSEARMIEGAQVVFWVGPELETFLVRPLAGLGPRAVVVEALRMSGVVPLPAREGGSWDGHAEHGPDQGTSTSAAGRREADPHLWLDPGNAKAIVRAAAAVLGDADPANRGRYADNAARLASRIDTLDAEVAAALAPVRDLPFAVFHDAYQYLERRYGLRAVGSIAVSPGRSPGARRVREIRERIRGLGVRCVFSEPQFPSGVLSTLIEGTAARPGVLDPVGAGLSPGPEAWFALLRDLAASLAACLQR